MIIIIIITIIIFIIINIIIIVVVNLDPCVTQRPIKNSFVHPSIHQSYVCLLTVFQGNYLLGFFIFL